MQEINIYRHLRFAYPTYMFDDIRFEIDDDGMINFYNDDYEGEE